MNQELAEIARQADLSPEAREHMQEALPPAAFAQHLDAKGLHRDAVEILAYALSKRHAVWWSCLCCWHTMKGRLQAGEEDVLRRVLAWLREPSDARRQAIENAGQPLGMANICGAIARSVFLSSGNVSPPGAPERPAAPELTQKIVSKVVQTCAMKKPEMLEQNLRDYVRIGLEISQGKLTW